MTESKNETMNESKEETMNESKDDTRFAAAWAVIEAAGFRTAKHDHETVVREARTGEKPGAKSSVLYLRPRDVGLPHAYEKQGRWVTASRHEWVLNPFVVLTQCECRHGTCVLIGETIRVRQGRGTGLVCERFVDGHWIADRSSASSKRGR